LADRSVVVENVRRERRKPKNRKRVRQTRRHVSGGEKRARHTNRHRLYLIISKASVRLPKTTERPSEKRKRRRRRGGRITCEFSTREKSRNTWCARRIVSAGQKTHRAFVVILLFSVAR